jgi:competence protein ComEC
MNIYENIWMFFFVWLLVCILLLNFYIHTKKYVQYLLILVFWFVFAWISASHSLNEDQKKQEIISTYNNGQKYKVEIRINKIYKKNDFDIVYLSKLNKVWNKHVDTDILVLYKTKKNYSLRSGNLLIFSSTIQNVENFNETFDYISYLKSMNVYAVFRSDTFEKWWEEELGIYRKSLYEFRKNLLEKIHTLYPKNEATYLGGILIWARENIPDDMEDAFNNSWLTHLIAVSGYNITIIIVFLVYILTYVPKYVRIFAISFFVIAYVWVVGDSAAVYRAALMWLIWYYVLVSWRKWDSLAIILLVAVLMTLYNPFLINYDISFQLSFLAVLWLLYTQNFFEKIFFFLPKKFALRESVVLTLSAFVFTIPIMIGNFGQISLLAPLANLLVAWTVPFSMLFGTISLIISYFSDLWAYMVSYLSFFFLHWTTSTAFIISELPGTLLKLDFWIYTTHLQVLYYLIVSYFVLYFHKNSS